MAVVGEASIIVKAITSGVQGEIDKAFSGAGSSGEKAGNNAAKSFSKGFKNESDGMILFGKYYDAKTIEGFKKTRAQFLDLNAKSYLLGVTLTAVGGIIGSLVGGLAVLGGVIGAAVGPALLGLLGLLGAVAAAAIVLVTVFKGVGDALKAQGKATEGEVEREKALARATTALADAKYNYSETVKETQRATEKAAKAIVDAADAEVDAKRGVESAERSYQDSVQATAEALADVTKAREDAKEAIQQLRFELEGGVISEKKARLEFEKARDSLQRVQDLPPNSRARREAELAFAEADLNLRRAIDKTGDLRKKTNQANKEGINGNKNVLDAEKNLIKSRQSQNDAEVSAFKAKKDLVKATQELAEAEKFAEKNGELFEKNRRALELADRAVVDATKAVDEAAKSGGLSEYEKAMAKLSPAAQEFVKAMEPIKKALGELKKEMQESFFPPFTDAVTGLAKTYIPLLTPSLKGIAEELGQVAQRFKNAFVTPEKQAEVKKIFDDFRPIVGNLGDAFIDFASALTTLGAAFSPYVVEFSEFVKKKAEAFKDSVEEKKKSGELNDIFEKGTGVLRDLSAAFGNTFSTLTNVIDAATGPGSGGQLFLDWLKETTAKWEMLTAGGDKNTGLKDTLRDLADNATKLLDFFGEIVLILIEVAASEGFGKFIDKLRDATPIIKDVATKITEALPAFGGFITSLIKFADLVVDAAPITLFFNILKGAIDILIFLLDNPFGKALLVVTGLLLAGAVAVYKINTAILFYNKSLKGSLANIKQFGADLKSSTVFVKLKSAAMFILRGAVNGVKTAFNFLKVSLLSNPFFVIALLVVALVATFISLYKNSEKVREVVDKAFKVVKEAVETAFNWIKENWPLVLAILLGPFGLLVLGIVRNFDEIVAFVRAVPARLAEIASNIWSWITDRFGEMRTAVETRITNFITFVTELPGRVRGAALAIWSWIEERFGIMRTNIETRVTNFITFVTELPGRVRGAALAIWSWIEERFGIMRTNIETRVTNLITFVTELPGRIRRAASGLWDGITSAFKDAVNVIIRLWNGLSFTFPKIVIAGRELFGGFTLNTPDITELARGGIVPATAGGTLAMIGEAGRPERVEPLDPDGLSKRDKAMIQLLGGGTGGGINITINPSQGMDERELASLVSRQLAFQMRKGA